VKTETVAIAYGIDDGCALSRKTQRMTRDCRNDLSAERLGPNEVAKGY
jgi:hypothetical protein